MARLNTCGALALAAGLAVCIAGGARGEDLPAVSAPNGTIEFDAGVLSLPAPLFMGHAAGALTLPVGQRFGVQLDLGVGVDGGQGFATSAVLHGFTRDPQHYLIGGAFAAVARPGAVVYAAGPEAELYFDRWTLAAWGGVTLSAPAAPAAGRVAPFATADVSYYPEDNWRFTLGVSLLDGAAAAHAGTEYLFDTPLPLAVTADARIDQRGAVRATVGLRAYFSPNAKTLIRRQREDIVPDRRLALYAFGAPAAAAGVEPPVKPPKPDGPTVPPGGEPTDGPSTPPGTGEPEIPPRGRGAHAARDGWAGGAAGDRRRRKPPPGSGAPETPPGDGSVTPPVPDEPLVPPVADPIDVPTPPGSGAPETPPEGGSETPPANGRAVAAAAAGIRGKYRRRRRRMGRRHRRVVTRIPKRRCPETGDPSDEDDPGEGPPAISCGLGAAWTEEWGCVAF